MAKRKKRIFMHEKAFLTVFLCNFFSPKENESPARCDSTDG